MIRSKKNRVMALVLLVGLAGVLACTFSACRKKQAKNMNNVVLIVIDALRSDHLPFYGYYRNTAPFLTGLAGESVVFKNAFSASSWTSPGTASIFTSLYPYQHGVLMGLLAIRNAQRIDPGIKVNRIPQDVTTLPEVLKKHGYLTYGIADNLNIGSRQGFDQGFDKFRTFMYKEAPNVNDIVKSWQKKLMSGGKYFLYIHYMEPHAPYHAREPWFTGYYNAGATAVPGEHSDRDSQYGEEEPGIDNGTREERRRRRTAAYDSEINYVDRHIKELFERFQWDKNTLVIITSDHGEGLWDHGLMAHGKTLYREEIQVPLLFYLPGKKTGKRVTVNAGTIDILPTVRDFLGLPKDNHEEGVSLVPLFEGREDNPDLEKRSLFSYLWVKTNDEIEWKSAIYKNWHFIVKMPGFKHLYSLLYDREEQNNRLGKGRTTALVLEKRFEEFMAKCKKYEQKSAEYKLDKKETDKLKSLGYVH